MMCVPARALALAALAAPASAAGPASAPPGYALTWADEFESPAVDTNEWTYRTGRIRPFCIGKPAYVSIENGAMKVLCARDGANPTGGGLITRRRHRYGYFETRARMDGGPGFHESMWTTWLGSMEAFADPAVSGAWRDLPKTEIDCFEHYATHGPREFSYGIIEWFPAKGSVSRDLHTPDADLARDFHVFGFEFQPDYCNFFFDGRLIRSVDVRDVPQNDFHIWLTCIATQADARPGNGGCLFDYLRCYALEPGAYPGRRAEFLKAFDAETEPGAKSAGIDLWIEAEDFARKDRWNVAREEGVRVLRGLQGGGKGDVARAATRIQIPAAGTYRLWARGRDFAKNSPGARFFRVAVNGRESNARFGAHGADGFGWQSGGEYRLARGPATIELIDASRFYARCDKLLLTTDSAFTPRGRGGRSNVAHAAPE